MPYMYYEAIREHFIGRAKVLELYSNLSLVSYCIDNQCACMFY